MDLSTSKNILILCNPTLDAASLKSCYSLAFSLAISGKKVSMFAGNKNVLLKELAKNIQNENLSILNQIEPKKTLLSINKAGSKIKNVVWKEEGDKLLLMVETLNGKFQLNDFEVTNQGTEADSVIFIACKDLQTLSFLYSINPELFTQSYTINIDTNKDNSKYGKYNIVKDNTSLAETIYLFIDQSNLPKTKEVSQMLLSGILADTKVFTQKLQNSEGLFQTVASLINNKADYQLALNDYEILNKKQDLPKEPDKNFTPTFPIKNVTQKNTQALDRLFPKAETIPPVTNTADPSKPLFSPYTTPSINKKPSYPQYQGFIPNKK